MEAKRQQVADTVASMAAALVATDARRKEAALAPPRPAAAPAAATAAAGSGGEDADAATPMQTDDAADVQDPDAGLAHRLHRVLLFVALMHIISEDAAICRLCGI